MKTRFMRQPSDKGVAGSNARQPSLAIDAQEVAAIARQYCWSRRPVGWKRKPVAGDSDEERRDALQRTCKAMRVAAEVEAARDDAKRTSQRPNSRELE